ncbi:MAG TPA: hypothetical protein VIH61_07115, partial [Waddliaceae bacterium]
MGLSVNNFFHYYIFHWNARGLTEKERSIAKITSIVLGIFTLGLAHLICRMALYNRSFKIKRSSDEPKTSDVSAKILNLTKTPSLTRDPHIRKMKKKDALNPKNNAAINQAEVPSLTQDSQIKNMKKRDALNPK